MLISICCRKGSKGLPNKHLLSFCGKPLVEWTILQAKQYARIHDPNIPIVVCSDSYQILGIAEHNKVNPLYRPYSLAKDDTPKLDVLRFILSGSDEKHDIIDLDATNPCRTARNIAECVGVFEENRPKTLFSVTNARKTPYFNQVEIEHVPGTLALVKSVIFTEEVTQLEDSTRKYIGKSYPTRRQDTPQVLDLNSNIYLYRYDWLVDHRNKHPLSDESEVYLMDDFSAFDIDSRVDFQIAELMFKEYFQKLQ